jgi:hypothetical protein
VIEQAVDVAVELGVRVDCVVAVAVAERGVPVPCGVTVADEGILVGELTIEVDVRVAVPVAVDGAAVEVGDEMTVPVESTVDVLDGGVASVVVAVGLLQSLVYNNENVLRGLVPPLCEMPPAMALPGDRAATPKRVLVVVPELALLARVH